MSKMTSKLWSELWVDYIEYLKQWAEDHKGDEFRGMSPACWDEWLDMEG